MMGVPCHDQGDNKRRESLNDFQNEARLNNRIAAATLAAALIANTGRPHSVDEAIKLMYDFEWSMMPSPGQGRYEAWSKEVDTSKPHE